MFVFLHFLNCLVQEAQQAVNAVIAQVYSNDTQVIESILLSCDVVQYHSINLWCPFHV